MEKINKAIWFFGLSGAGKTTLAKRIARNLENTGQKTILLDGDIIRDEVSTFIVTILLSP